jgi:acetyl esterase
MTLMTLDPDLEAFLDLVEAGTASGKRQAMHTQTPAAARAAYEAASPMLDLPPDQLSRVENIRITTREGASIAARLYLPLAPSRQPLDAVLLYFHGGGYCVGSLDTHDSLCSALAARTPCPVLAVDYRLAPEHRFPTAFHDAEDAYGWLLEHAAEYGLDRNRIAVGGDSAGGTLAAALALNARGGALPPPVMQLLLYPCTAATQDSASHRRYASGYLLEADTLQWMFGHYLRHADDRLDWRFAPLRARDARGVAPALIVLGDHDPLFDEGVAYVEKLIAAGVPATLKIYPGMIHDFLRLGNIVADADTGRGEIAQALAKGMAVPQ